MEHVYLQSAESQNQSDGDLSSGIHSQVPDEEDGKGAQCPYDGRTVSKCLILKCFILHASEKLHVLEVLWHDTQGTQSS